jgi:RND family efflux transporter, MFP subunit
VTEVNVSQGDRVTAGDILATLDTQPFDLDVQAAQSELNATTANFNEARLQLERQRKLFENGWVAEAALDTAEAAFETAEGELNVARSRLGLAQRDLDKATLIAPFDGVIAMRDVEPFTEVNAGAVLFRLDTEGSHEVELSIPDSVVGRLAIGTPVQIAVDTIDGCGCTGRIIEIGAQSGAANTVMVTAAVTSAPEGLIPGMAVEASILMAEDDGTGGFLIPIVALSPGDIAGTGYVFRFDPSTSTVERVAVQAARGNLDGNLVGVSSGVQAGDIIAAAGVSFLRDGQAVTLLSE